MLAQGGAELRGVMSHSGGSYGHAGADALRAAAEAERSAVVSAATALRLADLPCTVVSVGSTPTALFARDLFGVTEVRAGVFMFPVESPLLVSRAAYCSPRRDNVPLILRVGSPAYSAKCVEPMCAM